MCCVSVFLVVRQMLCYREILICLAFGSSVENPRKRIELFINKMLNKVKINRWQASSVSRIWESSRLAVALFQALHPGRKVFC